MTEVRMYMTEVSMSQCRSTLGMNPFYHFLVPFFLGSNRNDVTMGLINQIKVIIVTYKDRER